MKIVISIVFLLSATYTTWCQAVNNSAKTVIDIIKHLHTIYNSTSNLSFNILYTYSGELEPDKILDSISGFIQTSNKRLHMRMGPTETVNNGRYSVMLFTEEHLMYITKPSSDTVDISPLTKLDNTIFSITGLTTSIEKRKGLEIVDINFSEARPYKTIQLTIDKNTGYLVKTKFVVKADAVNSEERSSFKNMKTDFAIIEATYSDYNKYPIDDSIFMESRYFIRNDKAFVPTKEFENYKMFIGSPNL